MNDQVLRSPVSRIQTRRRAIINARFDLVEQGSDTKIVFEHAAFPQGDAANLVNGWRLHYWQPLEKFVSKAPAAEID